VLSDIDGTLLDSRETERWAWGAWARRYGLDPAPFTTTHGLRIEEKLARYAADLDPVIEAERLVSLAARCPLKATALPGALQLLNTTPAVALVTSGKRAIVLPQLAGAGLAPLPPVIVAAEDVHMGKPNSEPYLTAAGMLGVVPACCTVLEDAPAGVRSGVAAGMAVVAVTTTTPAAELWKAGARLVVPDVATYLHERARGTLGL
jgi:sugar-phosphatase